jgi:hypothetical protein
MSLLIRSLTNASSVSPIVLGIAGFDPTESLVIAPSATVDLLSVMTADSLHAMQAQLAAVVASGEATVAATIDSSVLYNTAYTALQSAVQTVGSDHRSAVAANFGPVTLFTVATPGMYQINYYIVNTTSGSGGDAVGQLVFNFPDSSGGNAAYASMPSGINATLLGNGTVAVYATAGNITYTLGSAVFAGGLRMEISATVTKL